LNSPSEEQLDAQKIETRPEKKARQESQPKKDAHPFDNLVKALFGEDGAQIVAELVEGAQVLSAENVELDRSKLKADVVYKGPYGLTKRQNAVYDFEFQAGPDTDLIYRLLLYLAALYEHYKCLIICVIIYLFRCSVVKSPHIMRCDEDGEEILAVKFRVICLWEMDPQPIVAKHLLPLYTFLPAMKDPSVELLMQALKEMAHHYDRAKLAYRFMWFSHMLRRTDTMSDQDKKTIREEIKMLYGYEEIIQDDPVIQNLLDQRELLGKAEGILEGEVRGKMENMKDVILSTLSIRFSPALAAKAQPVIMPIQDYEALKRLHRQLLRADDEQTALLVLDLPDERLQHGSSALPTE
jgi:predicted transposase YdaD